MNARLRRSLSSPGRSRSLAIAVAVLVFLARQPPAPPIAGMVRQTEIRIAPEITGRLASVAVQAGPAGAQGRRAGRARQSRPRRRPRRSEGGGGAAPRAERDRCLCRRARRGGRDRSAEAVETAEANLAAGAAAECARRGPGGARLRQPPAARREQRLARQGAGRPRRSSGPSLPRRRPGRPPRSARSPTPRSRWPRRRSPTCRRSSTRRCSSRRPTARSACWSPKPGEVVPVGKPVMTLEAGSERWFAFTLREDALGD